MPDNELKPCPFKTKRCGNLHFLQYPLSGKYFVSCDCGASGPSEETKKKAADAWNSRKGDVYEVTADCLRADKTPDGKCRGYQKGEIDDEPSEPCKYCKESVFYEE